MSSNSQLKEFICTIPDNPGALSKRMEVRSVHINGATKLYQDKLLTLGGGYTETHPTEGATPDFLGSVMIIKAESKEKIWEILRKDIYATSGVWDLEKAQVHPILISFRSAP